MKRRAAALLPGSFPPFAEFPIESTGQRLTAKMIRSQVATATQKVLAAAPVIPYLECLELAHGIERRERGFAIALYLVEKRQQEVQLKPTSTSDDWNRALKRDIKSIVDSIAETQSRLDRVVASQRKKSQLSNEATTIRSLGAEMHGYLEREEGRLLEVLRRHGGSVVDFLLPEEDGVRLVFPFYPDGDAQRSAPVQLRSRVTKLGRGQAELFYVSRRVNGEWVPLVGLKEGTLRLEWDGCQLRRPQRSLAVAAVRGTFVELSVTLIEAGTTGILVKAELDGEPGVSHVRERRRNGRNRRSGGSSSVGAGRRSSRTLPKIAPAR